MLATLIDRQVRIEGALRTAFLYPYAMSFVATGVVWQWLLNPSLGIQQAVRQLGLTDFQFDWIVDPDKVDLHDRDRDRLAGRRAGDGASCWPGCAASIPKSGRRRVSMAFRRGGSTARSSLPMLAYSFATAAILLLSGVVKLYDAVVAMTQGGPGTASEVPAKFIMDHLFGRANIALASAGSIVLLVTVMALLAPIMYVRSRPVRA